MSKEIKELVLCQCENTEHQMIIRAFDGEEDVYVTFYLRPLPLRERLVHGLKYIFGHRSKYGDFDEIILRPEDAAKFAKVAKWLKTNHNPIK